MGFKCFLCKCPPDKAKKITLYRFPNHDKYPQIHDQWLAACNLDKKDDVKFCRICSSHFREEDKLLDYAIPRIKQEAVPTINVKTAVNAGHAQNENNQEATTSQTSDERQSQIMATVNELSRKSETVIVAELKNIDDLDNHFELLFGYLKQDKICTTMTFPTKNPVAPHQKNMSVASDISENSNVIEKITPKRELDATEETYSDCQTPEKRRHFFQPRHISEVHTPDMATPKSASRILKLLKEKHREKDKKIKALQTAKRRLQKRLSTLEDLLSNIKKKK